MSLDIRQVVEHVIGPTLRDMASAHETPQMASESAGALMLGTGAHESGRFRYIQQLGGGPAMGLWQVEPATAKWLDDDILERGAYSRLRQYFFEIGGPPGPDRHEAMRWNLRLSCAYARLRYWVVPKAIPPADDEQALAKYFKVFYNTAHGKATEQDWIDAYDWCLRQLT